MNKIKILHFPIRNNKGGVTQYVLNNWKYINKEKFQFDFATMNSKLDFEEEVRKQGCNVFYLSCYAEEDEDKFIQEIDSILDNGYDVVHLHTGLWKSTIFEDRAKQKGIKKIVLHSHNTGIGGAYDSIDYKRALVEHRKGIEHLDETLATDYCACSWEAAKWLYEDKISNEKIRILTDAIEVDKFRYNKTIRDEYRRKLNLENNFVIGHVGRFAYQKNHEFLIEVFSKVKENVTNAVLLLIGTGELETTIKRKVIEKRLIDSVIFLGGVSDIYHWYQAMDLFVLPSRYEGFGMALLEAQIAGLPCIASNAIPDKVKISDGLYFEELDIERWYSAIVSGEKNRIKIDEQIINSFDLKAKVFELETLYEF